MAESKEACKLPETTTPTTTPSSRPRKLSTLITLPPELLLLIHSQLQPAAKLSLSLTTRTLYLNLPTLASSKQPTTHAANHLALSPCGRKAISSYLDYAKKRKNRIYCRYCEQWYPSTLYGNPWLPLPTEPVQQSRQRQEQISLQLLEEGVDNMGGPGMITLPPEICGWHRKALVRLISAPPSQTKKKDSAKYPIQSSPLPALYPNLTPGWYKIPSLLCLHCKRINTLLHTFTNTLTNLNPNPSEKQEESITQFCERMALWRSCPHCNGCSDCALIQIDSFVRIARGYGEFATDTDTNPAVFTVAEDEAVNEDGDDIFLQDPGRFVIYNLGNDEIWVREWESSKLILFLSPSTLHATSRPPFIRRFHLCIPLSIERNDASLII